jgi:hypothetical protein
LFFQASSDISDASVKVALPRRLLPLLTRCTTSPPRPASAMLMKCRTAVFPSWALYDTQPASSRRGIPVRRISTAAFGSRGIFKVRLKSPPVPSGSMARRLVVGIGAPL